MGKSPRAKAGVKEVNVGLTDPHILLAALRGKSLYREGEVLKTALVVGNVITEGRFRSDNVYPLESVAQMLILFPPCLDSGVEHTFVLLGTNLEVDMQVVRGL